MKTTILHHQSLLDLAIQHTGSVENTFDLALQNNRSLTDDLEAGESIEFTAYGIQQNKDILNYYTAKNIQPATAVILPPEEERLEGIGYWTISVDFKVS
ncbi:MAG: hypothetical protein ACTTJM_08945 [Bergeyella cardium]